MLVLLPLYKYVASMQSKQQMMARIEVAPPPASQVKAKKITCTIAAQEEQACSTCLIFRFFPVLLVAERDRGCGKIGLLLRSFPSPDAQSPHGGALSDHVTSGIGVLLGFDIHPCVPVVSDSSINLLICYENALIFG